MSGSLLYIDFSNNHVHLSREDLDRLGIKDLTFKAHLIAKGEYISEERVTIHSNYLKDLSLNNVAILGSKPERPFSIAELNPILFNRNFRIPYLHSDEVLEYTLPEVIVTYYGNSIKIPVYRQKPHMHTDPSSCLKSGKYDVYFGEKFIPGIKNKVNILNPDLLESNVIGSIHLDPCDYFAYNPYRHRTISTESFRVSK